MYSLLFSCNNDELNNNELNNNKNETENITGSEDNSDYVLSISDATTITLNGNTAIVNGNGATAKDSKVTITTKGTYIINGTFSNGQIVVKTDDTEAVKIVLDGVNVTNTTTSPLFVDKAVKVILFLNDSTINSFTDGTSYSDISEGQNAAVYSQAYLAITGKGDLNVTGKYKDGISGKDGLVIKSGNITVSAADDGIRGKDYLHIYNGNFKIASGGDGLISDNENAESVGFVRIEEGIFEIVSGGDGISAASTLTILSGTYKITSGGGSSKTVASTSSAKSIKAAGLLTLAGNFVLNTAEDAIHSNSDVTINGGTCLISAADDGIHATTNVVINSSGINITKSEEGIEAKYITINSGDINLVSSDDCTNATAGRRTESNDGSHTCINGGIIQLSSTNGDPLDSNGNITMKGGTVIIHGPKQQPEVPIDYNGTFNLDAGFLVAAGIASNMTQAPSTSSAQKSVRLFFSSTVTAGTLFNIQDESGNSLVTFKPERNYSAVVFSSPELTAGKTIKIYTGGTSTGTLSGGLISDGIYSGGTYRKTLIINGTITSISGL